MSFHKTVIHQMLYLISTGKGRGRQVIAVARTADVVIMMLDATKGEIQKYVQLIVIHIALKYTEWD